MQTQHLKRSFTICRQQVQTFKFSLWVKYLPGLFETWSYLRYWVSTVKFLKCLLEKALAVYSHIVCQFIWWCQPLPTINWRQTKGNRYCDQLDLPAVARKEGKSHSMQSSLAVPYSQPSTVRMKSLPVLESQDLLELCVMSTNRHLYKIGKIKNCDLKTLELNRTSTLM